VHFSPARSILPEGAAPAARCSLAGTLAVPADRGIGLRLWLLGPGGVAREIELHAGTYAVDDLAAGSYRVELRAPRLVLARRVTLAPGERINVDFTVNR
jgi:hypothetical protein